MPPLSVRCEYFPENFFAYALVRMRRAIRIAFRVMVGTVMTGPRRGAVPSSYFGSPSASARRQR